MSILNLTARQLVAHVKQGDLSVSDITLAYVNQILTFNNKINALVQFDAESALLQANRIDKNLKKYAHKILLGVPVTIKNACSVLGFKPDKGSTGLLGQASVSDATIVARLRDQGAIILGLTNTPEFSIGFETDNLVYGQTKNPYDLSRTPGGSSGGEAAALAARCSLIGIGSDATGSLRVPAHNTGIATIRLTQGRIPYTGTIPVDAMGLFSQFISYGPMARTVDDLALVSPVLIGPDNLDPHVVPVPWPKHRKIEVDKLNIAYYSDDGISKINGPTKKTLLTVVRCLKSVAHSVVETRPSVLDSMENLLIHSIFLGGDRGKWLKDIIKKFNIMEPSPLLMEFLELCKKSKLSITDLRVNWMNIDRVRRQMLEFMEPFDLIVCPVAATEAKLHGHSYREIKDFSYTIFYSLVNWPIVVVRCGTSDDGLPIGLQIIAKPWREDVALYLASYLETALGNMGLAKGFF